MDWTKIDHFKPEEFHCRCCGTEQMDMGFVLRLDALRHDYAKALRVTSGYRCPVHNARISTTGANGPHTTGKAADLAISGRDAYALVRLAMRHGFTGIGVSQKGPHGQRFLHLDSLPDGVQPRPWVWSY